MPKLTVLFPVYNSIARNGDGFLQQALDSLVNQTFEDFEIHILDNMSTDETPAICKSYAKRDSRIKFSVDSKQRFPEDGINKLAENVTSEFLMVANCDDLWNHYYIEILLDLFKYNQSIDLAYSNGNFVNASNHIGNPLVRNTSFTYTNDLYLNFCLGVQHRTVVPILFGIFKTEAYKNTLPFQAFDSLKANVDNLFLMKFLISGYKAKLHNESLFYYRERTRNLCPSEVEGMPESPILIFAYYILHQLNFYSTVNNHIPENSTLLKLVSFDSTLRCISRLLLWITKDYNPDKFETNVLETLHERYTVVKSLLLTNSYPSLTEELCKDTCKKSRIFKNHILQYIYDVMRPHKILEDITVKMDIIHKDFEDILNDFPNQHRISVNE